MRHNGRKIITHFDYPPIPIRNHDWSAMFDDYDGDPSCPRGHGTSQEEAIRDLIAQLDD